MTPEERYLFDLQGFLFIPEAISKDLVQQMNDDMVMEDMTNEDVETSMDAWHTHHNG